MDTLFLYNTKTLKEKFNTKVFAGDNHITKINVQIPDNIGGYPKRECEYNLRAIIPEGNLSYMINPSQPYFYITNDITEKAQTVKLMMIITHEGNVIGRTNTVDLIVNEPAEAPDPPLTPREEFDKVIAEQRAEIAEQAETITTQDETITQQSEQITELNGEVSELTTENGELKTQHTADQNTIQYLIDNPPEAHLQPKSVTPTSQMQVVEPDEGYQGMSTVTVGAVTPPRLQPKQVAPTANTQFVEADNGYEGLSSVTVLGTDLINPELDVFFKREVPINLTFNQQIVFASICLGNEMIRIVNFLEKVKTIASTAFANCSGIVEVNFSIGLETIEGSAFAGCRNLVTVTLPEGIKSLAQDSLGNCANLKNVYLPNSITLAHDYVFRNSSALQNVTLQNGFNCSINLSSSTLYSAETIVSWLEALADRTGETAYTLTIGTTNINKLTAEQRAIAINKNWNLA